MLLFVIFRLLRMKIIIIITFQKTNERDEIFEIFNKNDFKVIICIIIYIINFINLNMQKRY